MDFSQLALEKLISLFPELTSFIVSFKDVTDEANLVENSDVHIGVFILRFGSGFAYIPVITRGEVVQPIDSIFSADTQSFSPLIKSSLQELVNSVSLNLGSAVKTPTTVPNNPSVYDMVTPPRTGKFAYASSSKLVEFLSDLPVMVKEAMLEKFSSDKDIYSAMHRMFGLENIFAALKARPVQVGPVETMPSVKIVTGGKGLTQDDITSILDKGYVIHGAPSTERIAVSVQEYNDGATARHLGATDVGSDWRVAMASGEIRNCFLPKVSRLNKEVPQLLKDPKVGQPVFSIFENGDYSVQAPIAIGEGTNKFEVIKELFSWNPPITPKDVCSGSIVAMFTPEMELIGAYSINDVTLNHLGVIFNARDMVSNQSSVTINAFRNVEQVNPVSPTHLFIPFNTVIIKLRHNVCGQLETSITAAQAKMELHALTSLGGSMRLGYDGIEFTADGQHIGPELSAIEMLVIREGVSPTKAESFIKQAKTRGSVTIFMSKKAEDNTPQYGERLPAEQEPVGTQLPGAEFYKNVNSAIQTGDPQTVESTVISELLQTTNIREHIREYLPDIQEAINKLGRTLFLTRLNMEELASTHNITELTSFISNLRNVYRLLGDNYAKLKTLVQDSEVPAPAA